jgi:hypothetical protein
MGKVSDKYTDFLRYDYAALVPLSRPTGGWCPERVGVRDAAVGQAVSGNGVAGEQGNGELGIWGFGMPVSSFILAFPAF